MTSRQSRRRGSAMRGLISFVVFVAALGALAVLILAVKRAWLDKLDITDNPFASGPAKPQKTAPPGTAPSTAPAPRPLPAPPARPDVDVAELRRSIDRSTERMNLMGIVAALLSLKGREDLLREVEGRMAAEMNRSRSLVSLYERTGATEPLADHLRPGDRIEFFQGNKAAAPTKISPDRKDAAEVELLTFVALLDKGHGAKVQVQRHGKAANLQLRFEQKPTDWIEIVTPLLAEDEPVAVAPGPKPPGPGPGPAPTTNPPTPTPVPPPGPSPTPPPPPPAGADTSAMGILVDFKQRTSVMDRGRAAFEFKRLSQQPSTAQGWYAAARIFLEGDDAAWFVHENPGRQQLEEYFTGQKIRDVGGFAAEQHLAAASALGSRAKDPRRGAVFQLFGLGHLADAQAVVGSRDARLKSAAHALGLVQTQDDLMWGDKRGAAALSMRKLIGLNQGQEAADLYKSKYKSSGDAATKFVGLFAELAGGVGSSRFNWEAFHTSLENARKGTKLPEEQALFEMLAEAVRRSAGCLVCKGGAALGCQACQSTGQSTRITCPSCNGASAGAVDDRYKKGGGQINCRKCDNTGYAVGKCTVCKGSGKADCDACEGKGWRTSVTESSVWNLFNRTDCWRCKGHGTLIPGVAFRCDTCAGLGYTLSLRF